MDDNERYSVLVALWTHHDNSSLQWPAVVLGAVFVAISLLVDKVTVTKLIDSSNWGTDSMVRYGAGVPLLIVGAGMTVILYMMRRARKILPGLEVELVKIDKSFSELNHPKGRPSGAKLVW
jgi:hypothetical protein